MASGGPPPACALLTATADVLSSESKYVLLAVPTGDDSAPPQNPLPMLLRLPKLPPMALLPATGVAPLLLGAPLRVAMPALKAVGLVPRRSPAPMLPDPSRCRGRVLMGGTLTPGMGRESLNPVEAAGVLGWL